MQIIQQRTEFELQTSTAVAIGKFDGIHSGHKKLLEEILKQKEKGLLATVFTFEPSFTSFFQKKLVKELTTKREKELLFEEMGVDILIEYPMSEETAAMSPEDFIKEVLVKRMKVSYIAAGTDLSFGYKGEGNASLLQQYAAKYDFRVDIIEKICYKGKEISSSYIREAVEEGNMELAEKLLGNPYSLEGQVSLGNQLGRKLSMPTVNIIPPEEKLLPPKGVYFSKVELGGELFYGVTNIGYKPTVSEENVLGVETYIYDFEKVIYGENIRVFLEHFHRAEMKFEGVEALALQLEKDKQAGNEYHSEKK